MQTLNLTKRPAKIGKSVNTRTEMHGEEEVPAQDIPLFDILLSAEELIAITDEPTAAQGLFKMEEDQYIPRFLAVDWIPLNHKFVGATVKMSGGVPATTYKNGKIKNIWFKAVGGGMTAIKCTLQVNPDNGQPSSQSLINAKVSVTIKAQLEQEGTDEDQPDLPLDHQASVGEDDQPTSHMGRKIQAHARKSKKK